MKLKVIIARLWIALLILGGVTGAVIVCIFEPALLIGVGVVIAVLITIWASCVLEDYNNGLD